MEQTLHSGPFFPFDWLLHRRLASRFKEVRHLRWWGFPPSKPQHFLDPEVNQLALPSAPFAIARAFRSLCQPGVPRTILQNRWLCTRPCWKDRLNDSVWESQPCCWQRVWKMHRFHMRRVTWSFKHFWALSIAWGMSWVCFLRNVKPDSAARPNSWENSAFDEKPGAGPWFWQSIEVFTMGCCIGARTSQAEAGDKEFQPESVMGLA